jgi:hypothetical protein
MLVTKVVLSLVASGMGGFLYRWRGMAHKWKHWFPRPFNQIVFAMPYAVIAFYASLVTVGSVVEPYPWWVWAVSGFVLVMSTLGTLTGHGGWMDLGTWEKERDDERIEFIIKWARKGYGGYWYDFTGLCLSGIAVSLWSGAVLIVTGFIVPGICLVLSGALKGVGYAIGRAIDEEHATDWGEFFTGLFMWAPLPLILMEVL